MHLLTLHVQNGLTEELMTAARNGHVKAVEVLIAAGAQVNSQNKVRFTAFYFGMVGRHRTLPVSLLHKASKRRPATDCLRMRKIIG